MYILLISLRCNLSINTSKTIFILELRNIMPFCPDCGYKMLPTDRYCYNCGKQVFNEFSSMFKKTNLKTSPMSNIRLMVYKSLKLSHLQVHLSQETRTKKMIILKQNLKFLVCLILGPQIILK